ncbi:MAG: SUMF1/EgtB/PvdO family nonheme iron enzyme [Planctomycetaceae bacterium]|nr:SUMF1/EgtB/PvdO family nonheme iron enzyme [Planctomycetaceae bacterium]
MSDQDQGEYDLADVPEPRQPKAPITPGKPLPRLWKTEPDEDEEEELKEAAEAKKKQEAAQSAKETVQAAEVRQRARTAKPKESKKPSTSDGSEKKVLVEETPALDTYEARQRGRLIVGTLVAGCVGIFGWIFYNLFIYDPNAMEITGDEPPPPVTVAPAPKKDLDLEAQNMFDRAREDAKAGRTKEAIALLENVVKSYRGTRMAGEASKALERPKQNLPLFLDRLALKAEPAPIPPPPPETQPTQVVTAQPKQITGNATLTLPANPAELTPTHPSPLAMASTTAGTGKTPTTVRILPSGFTAKSEAGIHSSGWPQAIVGNRDGAPMVLVPGGTFTMGNDNRSPAEAPSHKVALSTYYIDQHEVTTRQFRLFLAEMHYRGQPPRSWSEDFRQNPSETLPMVMVNARDAQAYSEWALKQMPTEAQWEMAARSTDGRLYPWGSEPINLARPRTPGQVEPVMSVPEDASPYGVRDLGGSVLEWTKDWYDSKFYHQLFNQPVVNPTGPTAKPRSLELVVKGDRKSGSASARQGIMLEKRLTYVGFRCVLPVEDKGGAVNPGSPASGTSPAPPPPGQPPANPARPGSTPAPTVPF